MAQCNWNFGKCEAVATTILTKNNGEVVQLCEKHRDLVIKLFKGIASGEIKHEREDGDAVGLSNHWLVKNKIPS